MLRTVASKVMWVGRATVFLVGLAVILALTVGVVSRATAHTRSVGLFHLGHSNPVTAISTLAGSVANGVLNVSNSSTATTATAVGVANRSAVSPAVRVTNSGGGPALGLSVGSGKAPIKVSGGAAKVANLDADKVDGKSSEQFANVTHAHSGAAITSGTVAEARIDPSVARDSEVTTAFAMDSTSGLPIVAGDNHLFSAPAFTPAASGKCLVTVSTQINSATAYTSEGPYFRVAVKRGGTISPGGDNAFGHYFTRLSSGGNTQSMTRTAVVSVTGGQATQFGAFLGGLFPDWSNDDQASVSTTYWCTSASGPSGAATMSAAALKQGNQQEN